MAKSARREAKPQPTGVRQSDVAEHLFISTTRVAQLIAEGVFEKTTAGLLDLDACRRAYLEWLRDQNRRATNSAAAARAHDAKAEEIQLRIDEKRRVQEASGQAEAVKVIDEFFGALKSDLLAIPARVTTDLATRRKIENELDQAFGACAKRAIAAADLVETADETITRAVHGPARQGKPRNNRKSSNA